MNKFLLSVVTSSLIMMSGASYAETVKEPWPDVNLECIGVEAGGQKQTVILDSKAKNLIMLGGVYKIDYVWRTHGNRASDLYIGEKYLTADSRSVRPAFNLYEDGTYFIGIFRTSDNLMVGWLSLSCHELK